MKCPYCNGEMELGVISGDGRSGVYWKTGDKKVNFMDKLGGAGKIEAVKYTLASFTIEAFLRQAMSGLHKVPVADIR